MIFQDFNLHPSIMAGVEEFGYAVPTPIQKETIPTIMKGCDLIGLAQTGTGKTAAFVLPTLHRLMQLPRGKIGVLVISPTRELAEQTCEAFDNLGKRTGLKSIAIYGGVGMDQQVRRLRSGVEIAVACPGRLLDHIWKGTVDLSHLDMLVIDEADRMFDMGFLPDIKSILKCVMERRQTLLFSATMPPDIKKLIHDTLRNPVTVQIGISAPAATVSHAIYPVKQHLKTALLIEFLKCNDTESVLVFTRTKHRTDRVAMQLCRAGFKAAPIHGDLAQNRRTSTLDGFRSGSIKVLVATDIAARGIDVQGISHVINYDMPDSTDSYTHRIGRTGRIEQKGDALTFVTPEDAALIREIESVLKASLERRTLEGFNYSSPAPVMESMSGSNAPARRRPSVGHDGSHSPARRDGSRPSARRDGGRPPVRHARSR
ncbi:MAG: DEAD/DEAH box helicase [Dehalococcoidia bacterium]|nr:MAG: DEAD/DEAH box helicase [Dehalococcoidia bacterium]